MIEILSKDALSDIISGNKPTLIKFSAEWCRPCQTMKPIFEKLSNEYDGKANLCEIDVDSCEEEILSEYGIRSIPTFIFIKDELVCSSITGANSYGTLKNKLDEII